MSTSLSHHVKNNCFVFISGWGFTSDIWEPFSCYFIEAKQTIMLELPKSFDHETSSWEILHSITQEFITEIPKDSIIIAWSLGGKVAAHIAQKYPKLCKQLILISSSPKMKSEPDWSGICEVVLDKFIKTVSHNTKVLFSKFSALAAAPEKNLTLRKILNNNLANSNYPKQTLINYLLLIKQIDLRSNFNEIMQKTLFIYGNLDAIIPVETATHIKIKYKKNNFFIEIIEGAGHISFLTHKDELAKSIINFIEFDR